MRKNAGLLTDSVVREFLSTYKTIPCHDPTCVGDCLYSHNQQQRRRNPYIGHSFQYYPTNFCDGYLCDRTCTCFHSVYEFEYHPLIYLTQACPYGYTCERMYCPHLHSNEETQNLQFFFRFDLSTFKSSRCHIFFNHQVKTCLFFHQKNDRRRLDIEYEHIMCDKSANCPNGQKCRLSHNKIEQLYHPSRYKSKFCDKYPNNIAECQYKSFCSFAHSKEELTVPLIHLMPQTREFFVNYYKTVWCPNTSDHERSKCPYAHNIQDFRRDPRTHHYEPVHCPVWKTADNIKSIEQAGCKDMMTCNKCHGRKEFEYHPLNWKLKNEKSIDVSGPTDETLQNKAGKKEECNGEQKPETVSVTKHKDLTNSARLPGATGAQIGAPFFKNPETRSHSNKSVRAKSDKGQHCSNTTEKPEEKRERERSVDSFESARPQFSVKDTLTHIIYKASGDKELFLPFIRPEHRIQHIIEVRRSMSESSKKGPKKISYSAEFQQHFAGTAVLEKLSYMKYTEMKILNLGIQQINHIVPLSKNQKALLQQKTQLFQSQHIEYSKELSQYFKKFNKLDILHLLRNKRIKQMKLLQLSEEEIDEISFLDEQDKISLPKVIRDFVNHQEFKELDLEVKNKLTEMDDNFFQ